MKNQTYLSLLVSILLLFAFDSTAKPTQKETQTKFFQQADIEKQLGRKLRWTERISLKLINKKLAKKVAKQEKQKFDGFAIAGFVASITALLLGYAISLLLLFSILAIVLSAIGLKRTRGSKELRKKGRGLASAGLVIGIIVIFIWAVFAIGSAIFFQV